MGDDDVLGPGLSMLVYLIFAQSVYAAWYSESVLLLVLMISPINNPANLKALQG